MLNEYTSYILTYKHLHKLMTKFKSQNPMNGQPMNELYFQSIMGEYLIDPTEYYENHGIRKAYALNDESMLRKILESEY